MKKLSLLCVFYALAMCSYASAATISFEQFADSTQITTQYAGLTFINAVQLTTANVSNDFANFPSHSGHGVITNDPNEDLTVVFANAQTGVTVFYTDFFPLTVSAYNASHQLLGSSTGASNIGSSSLLSLNVAGISSLIFSDGSAISDQFVLDDLTYETGNSTGDPGGEGGGQGDGGTPSDGGTPPDNGNPGNGGTTGDPGSVEVVPEPGTLVLV